MTPYTGLSLGSEDRRRTRLGVQWRIASEATLGFEAYRDGHGDDDPADALTPRGRLSF